MRGMRIQISQTFQHRLVESEGLSHLRVYPIINRICSGAPTKSIRNVALYFGDPTHYRWKGVVAISRPWREVELLSDPGYFVLWRGLFVFGDRDVIYQLTGMRTDSW